MDKQVNKKQALQRLTNLRTQADGYSRGSFTSSLTVLAWLQQARDVAANIFGLKSRFVAQFEEMISYAFVPLTALEMARMLIDNMIEEVKLWPEPEVAVPQQQNRYFRNIRPAVEGNFAFVLMPFKPEFFRIYDIAIKPAVNQFGLQCFNAQEDKQPTRITDVIFSYIESAKLLIADLTSKNPNVFYELGLAHAMNKPVILIARTSKDVPFDVAGIRYIEYSVDNLDMLKQELEKTITTLLSR